MTGKCRRIFHKKAGKEKSVHPKIGTATEEEAKGARLMSLGDSGLCAWWECAVGGSEEEGDENEGAIPKEREEEGEEVREQSLLLLIDKKWIACDSCCCSSCCCCCCCSCCCLCCCCCKTCRIASGIILLVAVDAAGAEEGEKGANGTWSGRAPVDGAAERGEGSAGAGDVPV